MKMAAVCKVSIVASCKQQSTETVILQENDEQSELTYLLQCSLDGLVLILMVYTQERLHQVFVC